MAKKMDELRLKLLNNNETNDAPWDTTGKPKKKNEFK